jgi:hypothetical protein
VGLGRLALPQGADAQRAQRKYAEHSRRVRLLHVHLVRGTIGV